MQKTKFAFVSLLSLLVVVAPVSTVLAQSEPVRESVNGLSQKKELSGKQEKQNDIFQEIEKQGGDEVGNKKLDEVEGEFGYWGSVGMAALGGAVGGASYYSFGYVTGQHGWDWSEFTGTTIGTAAGAASSIATGMAGAASAVGTVVGGAIGDVVGGLW